MTAAETFETDWLYSIDFSVNCEGLNAGRSVFDRLFEPDLFYSLQGKGNFATPHWRDVASFYRDFLRVVRPWPQRQIFWPWPRLSGLGLVSF